MKVLEYLKLTPLYELISPIQQKKELADWVKRGQTPPTPNLVKQEVIKNFAKRYKINTFVETGTYLGNTTNAVKEAFEKIYTVELSKPLYKRAQRKFKKDKNIVVIEGDSSKVLPNILKKINNVSLFWLDAHFSKGITAKASVETPIKTELKYIVNHKIKQHIILIDDANNFGNEDNYPPIKTLRSLILKKYPKHKLVIKNNIIQIYPSCKNISSKFLP